MDKLQLQNLFEVLNKKAKKENFYSDFNYFSKSDTRINIDKSNTDINKDNDLGIKIRIFDGAKFLESATSSLDENVISSLFDELLNSAKKNSILIDEKIDLNLNTDKIDKDFKVNIEKDINSINLEDKVILLKDIRDKILSYSDNVINARILLVEELETNYFVNEYKKLSQEIPEIIFVMVGFVNCDDGIIRTVYESFVSNDLNVLDRGIDNFDKFTKKIDNVKKAKKLVGGKYKAILSPKLSGLLAHESFGHGMEADTMMKDRALASEWIGKKIGNDEVNIVDYPNITGKHGQFFFDHEGNLAKKTYLVENGIINEPMADLYSKTRLGLKNSSNSRFESFDHKNYTRMSNTYFEAGSSNLNEMILQVEDGILILDSSGGMEDPKGWGVQIQGNFGQRILNGKLVDEFYDGFTLTGFLPDIVKNISAISNEIEIEGGGSCGKGHKEWVRVSEGGPYLLVKEVILG